MAQSEKLVGRRNAGRPVTVLLSYARSNTRRVGDLQRELKLRGVRAWRDITNLPAGAPTADTIRDAIRHGTDAFVAYVTPQFLESDFIWNVEIPEAVARHETDQFYRIIPIFDRVTPPELTARCASAGETDLSQFHGRFAQATGRSRRSALKEVARATLQAVLAVRFEARRERPLIASFQCGPLVTQLDNPDLEIDWSGDFSSPCPPGTVWIGDLLPALRDVREVVASTVPSRLVVAEVHARLSAALAFGHAISSAARLRLILRDNATDWCASRGRPGRELLRRRILAAAGDTSVAAIEVAISRATSVAASDALGREGINPGRHLVLEPVDGCGSTSIGSPEDAADMARQVSTLMQEMHDEGVKTFHLFVASPPAWAALLGHLLNAVGEVVVHQWDLPSGYRRGCTLF